MKKVVFDYYARRNMSGFVIFIVRDITTKWFQGIAPETILSTV